MDNERNEQMEDEGNRGTDYAPSARPGTEGVKEKAQRLAGEAKREVGDQVTSGFRSGKEQASHAIDGVAKALLQAGETEQGAATQYIRRAGEQMQRLGDYVKHTDLNNLFAQTESFARRQPALFLGGTFALGILAARFIKSGRPLNAQHQRLDNDSAAGDQYDDSRSGRTPERERQLASFREVTSPEIRSEPSYQAFKPQSTAGAREESPPFAGATRPMGTPGISGTSDAARRAGAGLGTTASGAGRDFSEENPAAGQSHPSSETSEDMPGTNKGTLP